MSNDHDTFQVTLDREGHPIAVALPRGFNENDWPTIDRIFSPNRQHTPLVEEEDVE